MQACVCLPQVSHLQYGVLNVFFYVKFPTYNTGIHVFFYLKFPTYNMGIACVRYLKFPTYNMRYYKENLCTHICTLYLFEDILQEI
mgnify:CR=1 FL=1